MVKYLYGKDAHCGLNTEISPSAAIAPSARLGSYCVVGNNVVIDENVVIGDGVKIWHNTIVRNDVKIGDGVTLGNAVLIEQGTRIGEWTTIQSQCHITGWALIESKCYFGPAACCINETHIAAHGRCQKNIRGPYIRHGARVGARSVILPGVTIGINAYLGAGAVATKDVPDTQIWVGNPAKYLRDVPPAERV